jgi:hypothetical protein
MFTLPSLAISNTSVTPCGAHGQLGTALPPGSSQVLDSTTDTLVPCTAHRCPYAIPSASNSSVLLNFVPMTSPVILSYLPNPSLVVDTSAALGAFASHDTTRSQAFSQAYLEAMQLQPAAFSPPVPGVSDSDIAAAVAAVARSTVIARPSFTIDPRPFLRLGYELQDTAGVLSICAEILAFKNRFRGSPVPGAAYFRSVHSPHCSSIQTLPVNPPHLCHPTCNVRQPSASGGKALQLRPPHMLIFAALSTSACTVNPASRRRDVRRALHAGCTSAKQHTRVPS